MHDILTKDLCAKGSVSVLDRYTSNTDPQKLDIQNLTLTIDTGHVYIQQITKRRIAIKFILSSS